MRYAMNARATIPAPSIVVLLIDIMPLISRKTASGSTLQRTLYRVKKIMLDENRPRWHLLLTDIQYLTHVTRTGATSAVLYQVNLPCKLCFTYGHPVAIVIV
jgi:hypothetical protein